MSDIKINSQSDMHVILGDISLEFWASENNGNSGLTLHDRTLDRRIVANADIDTMLKVVEGLKETLEREKRR